MKTLRFIKCFFKMLGTQNDYLYQHNGIKGEFPFKKPHLWKTRIGFKTSFDIAKILTMKKLLLFLLIILSACACATYHGKVDDFHYRCRGFEIDTIYKNGDTTIVKIYER